MGRSEIVEIIDTYQKLQRLYKSGNIDLELDGESSKSGLTSKQNSVLYTEAENLYKKMLDSSSREIVLKSNIPRYLAVRCLCLIYEIGVYYFSPIFKMELSKHFNKDDERVAYKHFSIDNRSVEKEVNALKNRIERLAIKEHRGNILDAERYLLKGEIRLIACKIHELNRKHWYEAAIKYARELYKAIDKLSRTEDPLHCLKGAICFVEGLALRANYKFEESYRKLGESCEQYAARKTWLKQLSQDEKRKSELKLSDECIVDEFSFADWKIALCLGLGIGFLNFTHGNFPSACQNIAVAVSMLTQKGGRFYEKYLQMQYAAAKFSLITVRDHSDFLIKYSNDIFQIYQEFKEARMDAYAIRAALEACFCFMTLKYYDKVGGLLAEMKKFADAEGNSRLKARVLTLECRFDRKTKIFDQPLPRTFDRKIFKQKFSLLEESEKKNNDAYNLAANYSQVKAEVLIGIGICYTKFYELKTWKKESDKECKQSFDSAIGALDEALEILKWKDSNPNIVNQILPHYVGLCLLFKANLYLLHNSPFESKYYFERWQSIKPIIDHQRVIELGDEINEKLRSQDLPLMIYPEEIRLNSFDMSKLQKYEEHLRDFVRFQLEKDIRKEVNETGKKRTAIINENKLKNFLYGNIKKTKNSTKKDKD